MKQVRETSYITILRPSGLEYAAMVCDPTTQTLIQTLENVQRRAARFVINDYTSRTPGCVTSMLTLLEWQTLEQRRRISRLRSSINSWTSTETCTSDLVTTESEINIGSSRRGPIMTLSETPSKEQHESETKNSKGFSCT
jgi:hypothetical protein